MCVKINSNLKFQDTNPYFNSGTFSFNFFFNRTLFVYNIALLAVERYPSELVDLFRSSTESMSTISYSKNACEDEIEFKNSRRNPKILSQPHLALTEQYFLLTEQNLSLTEHC